LSWGLLSGLGGRLDPVDDPDPLYRLAATRTLELLTAPASPQRRSIEELLLWRDNNWKDVEDLIVQMLRDRNRWYRDFVFDREIDWDALRRRLEAPFCRAARLRVIRLAELLDRQSNVRDRALALARFACCDPGKHSPSTLAERAELPSLLIQEAETEEALLLADALDAHRELAKFLLTNEGSWRSERGLNVHHGFPPTPEGKAAKKRFSDLVQDLNMIEGLESALAAFQKPIPVRYTDDEWDTVRHCFLVLRTAAAQLQVVFAETGSVDFVEVAQIALQILAPKDGNPSDFALRQADNIRHLLVDEFQDTSRRQHELLSRLIAAWPSRDGRSCFCVGDPMQSIYGFREAEVELFERIKTHGLEIDPESYAPHLDLDPLHLDFVALRANFRTVSGLVRDLNNRFEQIFDHAAEGDGSVEFFAAEPVRKSPTSIGTKLHLDFTPSNRTTGTPPHFGDAETIRKQHLARIVALIQSKLQAMPGTSGKYRIAVLAQKKKSLIEIAAVLRKAGIVFRAIELEPLRQRPEVLDVLSLAHALFNPADRTAWLAVLRTPWCGLSLEALHRITSDDDPSICATSIPELLESRLSQLAAAGLIDARSHAAASRASRVMREAVNSSASGAAVSLGTWLHSVWKALGGADTVDAEQHENLRLLWTTLDQLPEGELDLVGPPLDSALDKLCAAPDPAAGSDYGVQLMTIHKSKGLEFEVVIVPDLGAKGRTSEKSMIAWLERASTEPVPHETGEAIPLTEFLIAPIQAKGEDASHAKQWVEGVKRARDKQELQRLLYVAATRAREELHLFARPQFTINKGTPELCKADGLLATAWPAFQGEIEAEFAAWLSNIGEVQAQAASAGTTTVLALAASNSEVSAPAVSSTTAAIIRPTILKRLPSDYLAPEFNASRIRGASSNVLEEPDQETDQFALYTRPEGQLRSRIEGTAIHMLLEHLSHLRLTLNSVDAAEELKVFLPRLVTTIRSHGLDPKAAKKLAEEALAIARQAATHPVGEWILSPHPSAGSETRWTGLLKSRQWNLRPDRIFFAPLSTYPGLDLNATVNASSKDSPVLWIIDYKTSHASGGILTDAAEIDAFLAAHRDRHAGQLSAYAEVLRSLPDHGGLGSTVTAASTVVHTGIFYPRLGLFDFWPA